jgi:monofunctional biosynthetic peptidoglycan transglycosylase
MREDEPYVRRAPERDHGAPGGLPMRLGRAVESTGALRARLAELTAAAKGRVKAAVSWFGGISWRGIAQLAAAVAGAVVVFVLVLVVLYRWVNPPASTLMVGQWLSGSPITQRWVPLARISPHLARAVILSEDAKFCRHRGVDWGELGAAIESAREGLPRGGSTIAMQVAKNLFLWSSRSYVRKALEIPLALTLDALWPKRRVLEIYLNIAEWGPGVFGAEAAARYYFGKPAAALSIQEAALLAVALPNPFERQADGPGPGTLRLAQRLMARMQRSHALAGCVRLAQALRAALVIG